MVPFLGKISAVPFLGKISAALGSDLPGVLEGPGEVGGGADHQRSEGQLPVRPAVAAAEPIAHCRGPLREHGRSRSERGGNRVMCVHGWSRRAPARTAQDRTRARSGQRQYRTTGQRHTSVVPPHPGHVRALEEIGDAGVDNRAHVWHQREEACPVAAGPCACGVTRFDDERLHSLSSREAAESRLKGVESSSADSFQSFMLMEEKNTEKTRREDEAENKKKDTKWKETKCREKDSQYQSFTLMVQ